MECPENLRYTKTHEWVRVEENGSIVVGLTDYAQEQLGELVYVELPEPSDETVARDEPFAVVESVKAASDVYAPVSGRVTEVNDELSNSPEVINQDPYGDGWMLRMEVDSDDELEELMSAAEYEELIGELG